MRKKVLILLAGFIVAVMLFSSIAIGAVGARDIKAYYRNIKIRVNGKIIDAGQTEPFIYNNSTYVPIRLVSEALDKVVDWDNNQNIVIINDKSPSQIAQQLAVKDTEINNLKAQNSYLQSLTIDLQKTIKELESEKKVTEDKKSDPDDYLEDYLYDEYYKWNKIKFDYKVKERKGDITLTIEFDRSDYKSEWNKLTDRKIENWLEDIYDYVEDEFPDAGFEGVIYDIDEREDLVEFEESRGKLKIKFYYDDYDKDYEDLEDDLNYYYSSGLTSYHKNFGKLKSTIEVDEYDYDDEIYITVIVDTSRYSDEWDDVFDTTAAEDWLYDIMDYAHKEYKNYIVLGCVENSKGRTQATFECSSSGRMKVYWK
ncbi:MAG: stalk domain-containing protein [Tepidanaerobacteraceae bacterium]|nr:stalk domain-containing protein [Tepidanaerobacteraceae bacterium]